MRKSICLLFLTVLLVAQLAVLEFGFIPIVNANPTYEDFTTYTEVDPNSHIGLVGTNHVDFQAWMNEDAYLYKDKGVDHFGTSWEHKIDVKYVSQLTSHAAALWMLSNDIDDLYGLYSAGKPAILVYAFYTGSASVMSIREYYQGVAYESSWFTMTAGTMYYLTVKRDGTAVTCKIYSDSARTNLLATLSLTLHGGQPSHRYVWVADEYNNGQARWGDFDIENLDLQEAAGQSYTVDLTETVTTAWNVLTKRNVIADFSQTITTSWSLVLSHGMFVNLPQTISASWAVLTQWNAIASLSQSLSTVWNVLIQWTSNVGLTQSLSTAWTIITQTSYNIIASLSNTFIWTIDVLKYVGQLYTVDLSLTIVTSWIVNTIHTQIDWNMVAIGLAMVAFIIAAAAIALR